MKGPVGIDAAPLRKASTGVGEYCRQLLWHMSEQAPELPLIGLSASLRPPHLDPALASSVCVRRIPAPTRGMYWAWERFHAPSVERLLGAVSVYHAVNYFMPPVRRARRVMTLHDLAFLKHPEWTSPKIVKPFSRNVRREAPRADRIITISKATAADAEDLLGIPSDRIRVIYLGVDETLAPMEPEEAARQVRAWAGFEGPYILFVGTLEPRKNLPVLVRAFASIADRIPHKLLLAGAPGWGQSEVEDAVRATGLEERIVMPGYANRSQLAALYSGAACLAFPSRYEGFGLPVLEAMTCGCPVATSTSSSLPEVAGEAGLLVDCDDVSGLAEALERVVSDKALRESMIRKGFEQARKFSWKTCAAETLRVYEEVGE